MKKEIDVNIRHDAVSVPAGTCPFDDGGLSLFGHGLKLLVDNGNLP